MDIYQGEVNLISPAIGPYTLQTYINVDKVTVGGGVTGMLAGQGVTGTGTLTAVSWDVGVTGIIGAQFKNASHGF